TSLAPLVVLCVSSVCVMFIFFFQAEDGIRDFHVTGVQTCALPISNDFVHRRSSYCSLINKFISVSKSTFSSAKIVHSIKHNTKSSVSIFEMSFAFEISV